MSTIKFYEKLSKSEYIRVEELLSEIKKNEKLDPSDIFNSKEIPKMLDGITAKLGDGTNWKNLHLLAPFYKTIIVYICPVCATEFDDVTYDLIDYYLDKQVILPVIESYENYPSKFVDLLLQYPHTTIDALNLNIINNNLSEVGCKCKHCLYGERYDYIQNYFKNISEKKGKIDQSNILDGTTIDSVTLDELIGGLWYIIKVIEHDKYYTNKLADVINTKSIKDKHFLLGELCSEVNYTYDYLTCKSLKANYVLNFDSIKSGMESNSNQNNEILIQYPELQKLILQGLHLYSPKEVPDLNYRDLLIDNREKIQNIVKMIPENYLIDTNYIKIRSIVDEINKETKEISSSKRMIFLKFSTNFISMNINLLKSGILKFCGYKDVKADIPTLESKFKGKTIDYLSEKILPIYLQKPLPIIQLWKLQENIT